MSKRGAIGAVSVLLALSLGACASVPQSLHGAMQRVTNAGVQSPQERVHAAMDLMERGEADHARSLLESVVRDEPGNATAHRLLDQINGDPRQQLGQRSHTYTVRDQDTMSALAERFLGDPLLFYALARYNNMAPSDLVAGQTIQVPDRARAASAAARAPLAPTAPPSTATVAVTNADAARRANRLRLEGLERLNAGDASGAVALLRQAHALDAGNSAIQGDLDRAQRIQASLQVR